MGLLTTLAVISPWLTPLVKASCYTSDITLVGCYVDTPSRILAGAQIDGTAVNSPQYCGNQCGTLGYKYSGVEDGTINVYSISNPSSTPHLNSRIPNCGVEPLCLNDICNIALDAQSRAAALIREMTLAEKISNVGSNSPGAGRLGLPHYSWWWEGLHGAVPRYAYPPAEWSSTTCFPSPIGLGATFNEAIINQIGRVTGLEGRAYYNNGSYGLSVFDPNINPFRDPRWGRGQETPGEDVLRIQNYVVAMVTGMQGGIDQDEMLLMSTCKHYAAYDIEYNRTSLDVNPTQQDLAEYYTPGFKSCVRDAQVAGVMCSYNSVDGVPACANEFLLQTVLRDTFNFSRPWNWVVSDCDAVDNIDSTHNYVAEGAEAAAVALNAGTDCDCGGTYNNLNDAIAQNLTTEAALDQALLRLFSGLVQTGYFNDAEYGALGWSDVNTPASQQLAYESAVESLVLLKNDGTLPWTNTSSKIAIIGPWGTDNTLLLGNYVGKPPFNMSIVQAFQAKRSGVTYNTALGNVNSDNIGGFAAAISTAKAADLIIYAGGVDRNVEGEGNDREIITWPGAQLTLISELASLGKPLVVLQGGGGQVDDSTLLNNKTVNALVWVGYPGQAGAEAIYDVITGARSPAGRLPVTQYPGSYINEVEMIDMTLRPSSTNPGRTYRWYDKAVIPFGYGLHFTDFSVSWLSTPPSTFNIQTLIAQKGPLDIAPLTNVTVSIQNSGKATSDFVGLVFISTTNAGPSPYPIKTLASYGRAFNVTGGATVELELALQLRNVARTDTNGETWLYPGTYTLTLDFNEQHPFNFTMTGQAAVIDSFPLAEAKETAFETVGCFTDNIYQSGIGRALTGSQPSQGATLSPQICVDVCAGHGFAFAGVEYGTQCFCGHSIASTSSIVTTSQCNTPCRNNPAENCGGTYRIEIFNSTLATNIEPQGYAPRRR
ncbi:Xylobiase bxlB [Hyphodiscus hymeniophilus]|uniref:xylan 1,4-beta-xylosidase n=1 Tax=Hyphodiscus hymeniophilus TaxID=353542 RepID=A0A9P7B1E7_9HELO|nr:Xylobiase bxlB [Hyphodiscus hymeniophilus]